VFLLLVPGLADLSGDAYRNNDHMIRIVMKINFMLMSLFSAKLYIPAMNTLINLKLEKPMRAGLNSIFYVGTTLLTMVVNKINDFAMNGSFDDLVAPPSGIYKYYAISLFIVF
jgi:hypothetical protein